MRSGNKKIVVIIIIIFAVLAIAGTAFGYLFLATDTFKSDKELFGKYIAQNVEIFNEYMNSSTYTTYHNFQNESIYEEKANVKFSNSEGGEVSNPINDLSIQIDKQRNAQDAYTYIDARVLFKDEEYLGAEAIKDNDIYGVKFSHAVKQFVSVKDGGNISQVSEDIGIEVEQLAKIFEILDGTQSINEEVLSKEEMYTIKDKYLKIIQDYIMNGTFSHLKKSMITVNNTTVQTNSYTVKLSSKQMESIIIEILNTIKVDPIILNKIEYFIEEDAFVEQINAKIEEISDSGETPEAEITVYEQKGRTVRTAIKIGTQKIVIDNLQEEGQMITKIQLSELGTEEQNSINIEIAKQNGTNQEIYNILIDLIEGQETYKITLQNNMQLSENSVVINLTVSYIKDIETTSIIVEDTINISDSINEKQELDETNNVVLNDLDEEKRKNIINLLKENVPQKTQSRIELLKQALGLTTGTNEETSTNPTEMTQIEINKFNAKFEFYTGDSVSAENVKILLDIVKSNINSVEITPIENSEENSNQEKIKENIKLNIEKDKENIELINSILEKVEDNKKYKVTISYKDSNGLIDFINIREVEN